MSTTNEAHYDVNQEGPFWRVRPRHIEASNAQPSGLLEKSRQDSGAVSGSSRNPNAQPHADEEIKRLIRTGQSFTRAAADQYSRKHMGKGYAPLPNSPSSLVKQGPVGRAFALAATDHPDYKQRVFEAYKRRMPKVVADAKDYDDLLARAYSQLGKETKQQFDSLPINMSFHRNGEGNYSSSKQMLNDVFNNRHLYVFQGGDPHDFLHEVDPKTGLNTNEMFRAVHDFYGHTVHGNQFGPKGEEEAWAAHGGMFSPLARLAMSAETRGQNSFVNYTPINAKLKAEVAKQEEAAYHARRAGNHEAEAEFLQNKRDLLSHFQYAPQKSVLLPPEMVSEKYEGGMPGYLKDLIQPEHGVQAELTHFSHNPNLNMTDPRMYGTGIKGAEASRLDDPTAVKHRTYFYEGKPEQGEPGLGVHRYGATVPNLYPAEADPEHLRMLALEANRVPMTAMANAGMTSGSQAYTDMERLAKEYGYKGVLSRGVSMPTAAVFEPVKVRKMSKGGEMNPKYPSIQEMIQKLQEAGRTPIVPAPNRWFADPVKHPYQQKMIERVLGATGQGREGFPSGSYINPQTGEPMDFDIMHDLGVAIDPSTGRPMMSGIKSDLTEIDPKYGSVTKSNLVRKGLFKHEGGDELLKNLAFLATIEKSGKGHHYGLSTHYASPAELVNTMTGKNPTLRPHSRGDIFGVGDEVGRISIQGKHHPVYEKLMVAPAGSNVQGKKLHKAKGGRVTHAHHLDIEERPL